MRKLAGLLLLVGLLVGCGATPEPTEAPPTQTPWIVVITATSGTGSSGAQATQTPWIIIATPTTSKKAVPKATTKATAASGTTEEPPAETESPTGTETATVEPTVTGVVTEAASTSEPTGLKYPAPVLEDPPSGRPVGWRDTITLVWQGVEQLGKDEYYHVHMERPPVADGLEWYGDYIFTTDTTYLVEQSYLAPFHLTAEHGQAKVDWWVRIVRKTGEDDNGKPLGVDISPHSVKWHFVVEPRPDN